MLYVEFLHYVICPLDSPYNVIVWNNGSQPGQGRDMEHFPAFFMLKGRSVLVVGGGATAYGKARMLADAGACITVVAPELGEEMTMLVEEGRAHHQDKAFTVEDLAGQALVIAATGIHTVDADVSAAAQARHLPVNVIDAPMLSSFIIPTAEAMARLCKGDSRRFWGWFFARPIASAVLGSNPPSADKQTAEAINRGPAGQGTGQTVPEGTSTAKSAKKCTAHLETDVQPKDAPAKFFEVRIPAISALFVAHEVGGTLMLTSAEDIPSLNIEAGQTLTAQEVIGRAEPFKSCWASG